MFHHVQHGKVRSQVINVPEGFPELLSDITREVLRCQPTTECMCQFVIDYLHSVIVTRDKARLAKTIIDRALRTVDEIIGDMCICDITKAKADQMSEALEECFKRFLAKRRCEKGIEKTLLKFNDYDLIDELIHKCKFSDDELKISRPIIEKSYQKFVDTYMKALENTDGTESMYQYFLDREIKRAEERHRADAAIKIQANFRGFMLRKTMLFDKSTIRQSSTPSKSGEELEQAARKIQKFYRLHMSAIHNKSISEQVDTEKEACDPASNISLTAHPAGNQNLQHNAKPQDIEQKDVVNPVEMDPVQEVHEAAVEPDNVEIVHETTEETTVQFELQETESEINVEADVQPAAEEVNVPDEVPNE